MKSPSERHLLALVLTFAILAGLSGCTKRESKGEESEETKAEGTSVKSGRVKLPPGAAQRAGITVGIAGPARIDVMIQLPGEVKPDSGRVLVVKPRFAGVVHAMTKPSGAWVGRGETIARIQSNESLTDYTVTAAMSGRVVARGATVGENVTTDTPLYTIMDLSDVWVEFAIYPDQLGTVRQGQSVRIGQQSDSGRVAEGRISYVGPLLQEDTRVSVARVVLPNRGSLWQPGLFVTVNVITDYAQARVAVPDEAIVRTEEGPAVFTVEGDAFQLRRVATGRTDGRTTEIVSGLQPGARVAIHNAFVLKAELEKSEYAE